MKSLATTFALIVGALVALVPAAPAGTNLAQQPDLIERYVQSHSQYTATRGLAPSPEALAARGQADLVERYVATRGLAPSPEALASRQPDLIERYVSSHPSGNQVDRYIMTRGLAPSPEALAARAPVSDDGFEWGNVSIGAGVLFAGLLIVLGTALATRHGRDRYASV
jgi:hypothetical protein